ncbi:Uncharacterised protein [Yokenella regensburgei]|uniref:Uncharacterized protein n=1 Tax=Yokenella regensburgei TaxID=158877 RepID=A0AB38FWK2_9ENTR|nr:Uncharacterised protein [Yokenella regensburgei]SQB02251.1 Uncharacterised protein [Yokenella regensburgei]SUQ07448.1 Uncharacterised protein [Yokenella regensburgei]
MRLIVVRAVQFRKGDINGLKHLDQTPREDFVWLA